MCDSDERRRFSRTALLLAVRVSAAADHVRSGLTTDVSGHGLYLPCEAPFCTGTRCDVELETDHRCLVGEAIVARRDGGGMGLELRIMDLPDYLQLRDLIVDNAPDPARARSEFVAHLGLRDASSTAA